jgi:hypothetical protein
MQFAERLLKQFNPTMSDGEAKSKAIKMFTITKGKALEGAILSPKFGWDFICNKVSKHTFKSSFL